MVTVFAVRPRKTSSEFVLQIFFRLVLLSTGRLLTSFFYNLILIWCSSLALTGIFNTCLHGVISYFLMPNQRYSVLACAGYDQGSIKLGN